MIKKIDPQGEFQKYNRSGESQKILDNLKRELMASRKELKSINEKLLILSEELNTSHKPETAKEVHDLAAVFLEMIPEPAAMLNPSLHLVAANGMCYDTFALSVTALERPVYEVIGSPADMENWKMLLDDKSGSDPNQPAEFKISHRRADGEEQIFTVRARKFPGPEKHDQWIVITAKPSGNSKGPLDTSNEDVGAFKLMAENAPVMIWVSDIARKRQYFNKAWLRFTGKTLEEERGHGWEAGIHPDDRERSIRIFNTAFEKRDSYKKEYRLRRKDGEYRWILSQGAPFFKDGKFEGYIGSCIDINYRVEQEQQKDEFLDVVSHELKTPLTTIRVYTDLLHQLLVKENNNELADFTAKINIQLGKLVQLIRELLDISRINGKTLFLNQEVLGVNALVKEVVEEKRHIIKTHQLVVTLNPVKDILGDKGRLMQVLDNVISNAVKYSPGAQKVYIETEQVNNWTAVVIRDEGIGIPSMDQNKIFNRFFRSAETAKTFPGIGLGLYISQEIIRRHRGKIEVESFSGSGSVFRIKFPSAL